jgi:hypothetical protein
MQIAAASMSPQRIAARDLGININTAASFALAKTAWGDQTINHAIALCAGAHLKQFSPIYPVERKH